MARMNNRSIASLSVSFGGAALIAIATALPSFAAPDPVVTIGAGTQTGGALVFSPFSVTLNGSAQTPTTSFTFNDIVDARGNGAGWNISVAMTVFTDLASDTLLPSSLTIRNSPILSKIDPTSSATGTITSLLTLARPLDTGATIKLLSAATNGGMGSYNVSPVDLALALPANTIAGVYTSTANVSVNAVP